MENATIPAFRLFAQVAVDRAVDKLLDYGIPDKLIEHVRSGSIVTVPLRGKEVEGLVITVRESSSCAKVSPLSSVRSEIPEDLVQLLLWISTYYLSPLSSVIKTALPSSLHRERPLEQYSVMLMKSKKEIRALSSALKQSAKEQAHVLDQLLLASKGEMLLSELLEKAKVSRSPLDTLQKKGAIKLEKKRLFRSPFDQSSYFQTPAKKLNGEQAGALEKLIQSIESGHYKTHLLFGVTGSGKTEVYFQAMERALQLGKTALLLLPEIALTVQMIERLRSRFSESIAILHHRLSDGERLDEWERIQKGEAKIVVGARSALFSPLANLGLIIVDEEHDGAYKQSEKMPCYHGRDVAVMRGKLSSATVVLGSATPSMESFYNALSGKYALLTLKERATAQKLPKISIVDMQVACEKRKGFTLFSEELIEGIKKRLLCGEQTLLFLNRRGYHTTLLCQKCGLIFKCPSCDVACTYHLEDNRLSCHLCGYTLSPPPSSCAQCGSLETLKYKGIGTEKVESALHALFPEARILRIDSDTTRHKGSMERLLRLFRTQKSDILIGTQMVAKGHHFPAVTLVAVLNGDSTLHIPDFRSSEQLFQLLVQVAGRAGRADLPGEVLIQTHLPDHKTIQLATEQEYEKFFHHEAETRKEFHFPPFTRLIKFLFEGEEAQKTWAVAEAFREGVIKIGAHVHPLTPCGHPKMKDLYRFQFLLQGVISPKLLHALSLYKSSFALPKSVYLTIDVDPISTFF